MKIPAHISKEWYEYMSCFFVGFEYGYENIDAAVYDMWSYYEFIPDDLLVVKKQIDDLIASDYSEIQLRRYWLTNVANIVTSDTRWWFEFLRDSLKQFLADHPDFLPPEYRDKF